MLELMPAGQIDAAALAADNYFLSLLAAGAKQGILTDADLARLQSESFALLTAQTATYTGGESSSVRTETAQALLDSVFYTLGIVLKGFPTPDAALQALKSRSLAVLLTEGQDGIHRRVTAARARTGGWSMRCLRRKTSSTGRPRRTASAAFSDCTARRSLQTKRILRRIIRRFCRSFSGWTACCIPCRYRMS